MKIELTRQECAAVMTAVSTEAGLLKQEAENFDAADMGGNAAAARHYAETLDGVFFKLVRAKKLEAVK